jgi:hypothetical protein
MEKKKAQIWVETVVYTLIGISIIGIILAVAKPRIEETRDRVLIEQTIESFNQIHGKVIEIMDSPGNQRTLGLKLSKGRLTVDGKLDQIKWEADSRYIYSQLGRLDSLGELEILTEKANPYKVSIFSNYSEYNLTVAGEDELIEIEESPAPYKLVFSNKGFSGSRVNINLEVK